MYIIQTRQVVLISQTILFKFYSNSADILLHLHILFWLTDFLLPKCCHKDMVAQQNLPFKKNSIYNILTF